MSSLPIPPFVKFEDVDQLWQERSQMLAELAPSWRDAHKLSLPQDDDPRIALFGIDCQVGFVMPDASLQVPGALDDMTRACRFLYHNLHRITKLFFSMDTHHAFQIFHPAFWQDPQGQHPPPFTILQTTDIQSGKYTPTQSPELAKEYVQRLEASGKYSLMIWPYHCLLGGLSHALVPLVMEAALFHTFTRQVPPRIERKGEHPLTENYSVLEPEVKALQGQAVGSFNQDLFEELMTFDRIYIWGEASSHCVKATIESLHQHILQTDPSAVSKLYILQDCMSPVPATPGGPDFPQLAQDFLQECQTHGMHLVHSTDPLS